MTAMVRLGLVLLLSVSLFAAEIATPATLAVPEWDRDGVRIASTATGSLVIWFDTRAGLVPTVRPYIAGRIRGRLLDARLQPYGDRDFAIAPIAGEAVTFVATDGRDYLVAHQEIHEDASASTRLTRVTAEGRVERGAAIRGAPLSLVHFAGTYVLVTRERWGREARLAPTGRSSRSRRVAWSRDDRSFSSLRTTSSSEPFEARAASRMPSLSSSGRARSCSPASSHFLDPPDRVIATEDRYPWGTASHLRRDDRAADVAQRRSGGCRVPRRRGEDARSRHDPLARRARLRRPRLLHAHARA